MGFPPPVPPTPPTPPPVIAPVRRTNPMAIASLCCSIGSIPMVPTWILGIVFGHVALSQIRRDPTQTGRGMALAGVIIGWTFAALLAVGIVLLVTVA